MLRTYPRPERMWCLEDLALFGFCTTVSLGNLGIMGPFTFAKIFLIVGLPYWAARAFFRKDPWLFQLPFRDWIGLAMLALLAGYLLSTFNLTNPKHVGKGLLRFIALYVTAVWIACMIRDNRKRFYWLVVAFALSSIPNALGGIYELATKKQILEARASGTEDVQVFSSRFVSGGELAGGEGGKRCVSFQGGGGENAIHSIVWMSVSALTPFLVKSLRLRLLALFLIGINLINVVATGSRTGMIGLVCAVTVFLYFIQMRRKVLVVVVGVVGFLVAAVILDFPIGRLLNRDSGGRGTIEFRVLQWQTAYSMFRKNPILGAGPGNFMTEYHRYHYDFPSHDKVLVVGPLHNAVLNQMAEAGLVGLFLLILLIVAVILTLYKVRVRSPDPFLRQASVALMAAFAGWCAALFFYPSFLDEQGWIVIGLAIGIWNVHQKVLKETVTSQETVLSREPHGKFAT